MSLLRLALCSTEAVETSAPVELNDDDELVSSVGGLTIDAREEEQKAAALESFYEYDQLTRHLQDQGIWKTPVADAIRTIYRQRLDSLGSSDIALEAIFAETDAIALEGIGEVSRNILDGYLQLIVVSTKHKWNAIADFFTKTDAHVKKYSEKLESTRSEYDEKKSDFRDSNHLLYLGELYYFFMKKGELTRSIIQDLKEDLELAHFVLVDVPEKAIAALKKSVSIIGSKKPSTDRDIESLVDSFEKMPDIEAIFPKKYLGEKILFNNVSIEIVRGTGNKAAIIGGKSREKLAELAELARKIQIKEVKSKAHTAFKAVGATWAPAQIGAAIGAAIDTEKVTTLEIGQIISSGEHYLENVRSYTKHRNDLKRLFTDLERCLDVLGGGSDSLSTESKRAVKQIASYIQNIMLLVSQPGGDEVLRSIRGAKYCDYLAKRLIYNATKYF